MDVCCFAGYVGQMAKKFDNLAEILAHDFDTVIDVRSPSEFADDHLPGAINLPVLSDEQRAEVGTIYVQDSAFKARKIGGALVAQNAAKHLQGPLADKDGGWQPLVYCWRGGQRSGSFASILTQVGWRAELIEGGYRSYRRMVVAATHTDPLPHQLILLEGNTGTAKTELLHLLDQRGVQTVDLEALAAHRGSVLGAVATRQPTQKLLEGALAAAFSGLDPSRPVVVEAESSKIGNRQIPPSIWTAMRRAPRIAIDAPLAARAEYLVRAYADVLTAPDKLKETLQKLYDLQGKEVVEHWHGLVDDRAFLTLAHDLMERHYDPRYAKSKARDAATVLGRVETDSLVPDALGALADQIASIVLNSQNTRPA